MATKPAAARQALRVCWSGPLPCSGDALVSEDGETVHLIHRVQVLHRAEQSPKPRLLLSVTRQDARTGPWGDRLHPWGRTTPPARLAAIAEPLAVPVPVRPLDTVDARAKQARDKRLASEQAPPARTGAKTAWDDPEDAVNTRSPKQVRGYRRDDVLGHMANVGCDVTRDHLIAARMFRVDWDIAKIGLSGSDPIQDRVGGSLPGPVTGPTRNQAKRAQTERNVARCLRVMGAAAVPLLLHVVIQNGDIASWCRLNAERKPNRAKEMGWLLGILTRLAEFYGVNSSRERLKEARRDLSRP